MKADPEPVALLFLQPEMTTFPALKVTLDATETLTETVTGVLKLAVVALLGSDRELIAAMSDPGPAGGNPAGDK